MEIRGIQPSELESTRELLVANGWERGVSNSEDFRLLVSRSHLSIVAVEGGKIVGYLRAFSDGIANGYISMLVVAKEHRRRGIGRALVQSVVNTEPRVGWVLRAAANGGSEFYEKVGFTQSKVAMERRGEGISDT